MKKLLKEWLEIIMIVLVIIGLFFTWYQLRQNEKLSRDTYLTGLWNDIMRESINYPEFQDKTKTAVYDTYFIRRLSAQCGCSVDISHGEPVRL